MSCRTTSISYNGQGKPQTITDPRNKVTTLAYNGTGDVTSVTDRYSGNGISGRSERSEWGGEGG